MTYCVAARLNAGLVFLSDSRTNAGVDQISVYRKMTVFERPGERVLVLMTAGNLAVSQAVLDGLARQQQEGGETLWNAPDMFEAARRIGNAVREVYRREADALREQGVDFNVSLIFGGQIGAERCRLFQIYAAGNFIEASRETPYFQIGESKYGKPILDRVINRKIGLDEAAKCALVSMDSTIRSNLSVGMPLDMLIYERDSLRVKRRVVIGADSAYYGAIRAQWGARLRDAFAELPDPDWDNL